MGGICVLCLDFPPLEDALTIPPHSTYVMDICFLLFNVKRARNIKTRLFALRRVG